MKSWKGLVFFVFLNVLVSACATLTVLYIWDRNRAAGTAAPLLPALAQKPTPTATPPAESAATPQPTPTEEVVAYTVKAGDDFSSIAAQYGVTVEALLKANGFTQDQVLGVGEILIIPVAPTPVPQGVVQIKSVVGMGDLNSERVLIRFNGEGKLALAGWRLENGRGQVFLFPQIILFKDGAVNVYSRSGANSAIELFWGLSEPAWQSGDMARLYDAGGTLQGETLVP